jgi:hypothetical protein
MTTPALGGTYVNPGNAAGSNPINVGLPIGTNKGKGPSSGITGKPPIPSGPPIPLPNGGGSSSGGVLGSLTGDQRNAYSALVNLFNSYGLGSLAPDILNYVQQGFNSDTISLLLQNTDAYKQRFAGNAIRAQNGYAVLSPADYLATEQAYRQSMRAAGLPSGFYDSPNDFANFIGNDVSASEMNNRVQLASAATLTASPGYTSALQQMGLSQGDLTAYFLDPEKALPLLQQTATTAAIGSEAINRGLTFDQGYAKTLAQEGFTQSQAAQGYGQIASEFGSLQNTASAYGTGYDYSTEEQAVFQPGVAGTGGTPADLLRERLQSWQRANVSGYIGGAQGGLARHGGGQLS